MRTARRDAQEANQRAQAAKDRAEAAAAADALATVPSWAGRRPRGGAVFVDPSAGCGHDLLEVARSHRFLIGAELGRGAFGCVFM